MSENQKSGDMSTCQCRNFRGCFKEIRNRKNSPANRIQPQTGFCPKRNYIHPASIMYYADQRLITVLLFESLISSSGGAILAPSIILVSSICLIFAQAVHAKIGTSNSWR